MNTISVEELEKIDSSKITIVDVRPADQYSRGSFPGAVNIPLDEFEERMESVDREHIYFIAETKGAMSSMELREIEKNKIACAEKLFEQLSNSGVKYGKIDSYDTLMSLVK